MVDDLQVLLHGEQMRKWSDLSEEAGRGVRSMDDAIKDLVSLDWSFSNANTGHLTHNFHPYTAKFIPQLPRQLISSLSSTGHIVLDPFVGSGTMLVEALLLRRRPIGIDLNPLACLISKVKSTPLSEEQIARIGPAHEKIATSVSQLYGPLLTEGKSQSVSTEPRIPEIANVELWFQDHIVRELATVRGVIETEQDASVRNFLKVAFASTIVRVSNQDSETRYTAVKNKNIPRRLTARLLSMKLRDMTRRIREFSEHCPDMVAEVMMGDARRLPIANGSVDLVVTSPPYLNAWDYYLYHRFRMLWLGFDVSSVRQSEIGSHLTHYNDDKAETRYRGDMENALREMFRVLKPISACCIIIGDSVVKGERVDCRTMIEDLGTDTGFTHLVTIDREIKRSSKTVNPLIGRIEREHVVIFRR